MGLSTVEKLLDSMDHEIPADKEDEMGEYIAKIVVHELDEHGRLVKESIYFPDDPPKPCPHGK